MLLIVLVIAIIICAAMLVDVRRALVNPLSFTAQSPMDVGARITNAIENAMQRLERASKQRANVLAIVELMEEMEQHPDFLEQARQFPETVRIAAAAHYQAILLDALKDAREEYLSELEDYGPRDDDVRDALELVQTLEAHLRELEAIPPALPPEAASATS